MAKRETVRVDVAKTTSIIKSKCRSYTVFCERMGRSTNWVTDWKRNHNLPSPEEGARMCVILGIDPADILMDHADVDKVTALLNMENPPKNQLDEDAELNQEFMFRYNGLSEENQRKVDEYIALLLNAQSK